MAICILSGNQEAVHGCHVIDKGVGNNNFKSVFESIYGSIPADGLEDIKNIVHLQSHYHNGPMDNQNHSMGLKQRRISFDWIERVCYIEDFYTGEITQHRWVNNAYVNVKPEYFAWSNSTCSKKMKKKLRRIPNHGRNLVDWTHWLLVETTNNNL